MTDRFKDPEMWIVRHDGLDNIILLNVTSDKGIIQDAMEKIRSKKGARWGGNSNDIFSVKKIKNVSKTCNNR